MTLSLDEIKAFQTSILDHYYEHNRSMPWRESFDPYEILVSEFMLQQTQVSRVLPKYLEWLEKFPRLENLAQAPLAEVLIAWSGLGYNRRAKFLWETARIIQFEKNGIFPHSAAELEKLPGIGPYTARAILCFSKQSPEVFIETNIRSVYIFYFFKEKSLVKDSELFPLIEKTLYKENPKIWYYALMDYGATLKKKIKNPSRKSAHHTKQAPFKGSFREVRGIILKELTQEAAESLDLRQLQEKHKIEYQLLYDAAEKLCSEGLVLKEDDVYVLG
ncbi:MAG TPA: A/G-specific adenine glycosylase [Treponemataceae bacterium]|jgi:A/G-specific adenine glycosylase|nr:A/G-specific adenine glycosylase [Treponemataceae bacterium]